MALKPLPVELPRARRLWLGAQRLLTRAPFGSGPAATQAAVEHLGYVQIDTINVIERSHHHILFSRIPSYRRADLHHAQSVDKTVFEYWTHALAFIPTRDFRFFIPQMRAYRKEAMKWFANVPDKDVLRMLRLIRAEGPVTIRDIEEEPVEKTHLWASRKPSKHALERGFFDGRLAIAERAGMLKTYELIDRHFDWSTPPRPATPRQIAEYLLDRALRAQGVVSAPSVMHHRLRFSPELEAIVAGRVRRGELVPLDIAGEPHWATPETLEAELPAPGLVHILSPFDPLIIQRRRLKHFFGYEHLFEAYLPKEKRKLGYFALPVLVGDAIVAALDLKADRENRRLLVQAWHWLPGGKAKAHKRLIEAELDRFAASPCGD